MMVLAAVVTLSFIMPKPVLVVGDKARDMPHVGEVGVLEQGRSVLWLKAFEYLKEHPFSGIGFGRRSFSMKFPEMRKNNHQAGTPTTPLSTWLWSLAFKAWWCFVSFCIGFSGTSGRDGDVGRPL